MMFRVAFVLVLAVLAGCTGFSSQYERIENDRVRLIDFIYEPAEAAPGDTVHLKALFAGKPIVPEDITWKVCNKVVVNAIGFDTAYDEVPLDYTVESCSTWNGTNCIALRFVIPPDCILQSPMVPDDWLSVVPQQIREVLPQMVASLSKKEALAIVDSLSKEVAGADSAQLQAYSALLGSSTPGGLPLIMQLLTAKIRLYAYMKNSHRIKSDYSVSYNCRFSGLPGGGVYENHNPVIDSVGVYRVKGENLIDFERDGDNTEYFTLSARNDSDVTIEVKKGYTYFLEAFVSGRDSLVTLGDIANNESVSEEDMAAEWLFQMDEDEMADCDKNDLMNISTLGDFTAVLYVPVDKKIKKFTIWAQVTDSKLNVLNRSQGSMVARVHGSFTYP